MKRSLWIFNFVFCVCCLLHVPRLCHKLWKGPFIETNWIYYFLTKKPPLKFQWILPESFNFRLLLSCSPSLEPGEKPEKKKWGNFVQRWTMNKILKRPLLLTTQHTLTKDYLAWKITISIDVLPSSIQWIPSALCWNTMGGTTRLSLRVFWMRCLGT